MHHMRKREAHMKRNFILSIFFVSLENTSVRKLFYSQTKIYPIHEAGSQLSRGKGYTFFVVLQKSIQLRKIERASEREREVIADYCSGYVC